MKFLNPVYLWGISLIAAPIIIHLLFKKDLKKIYFSSLSFLKNVEAHRLRWLRLKEIIILIVRCILIASIFLALARPQYQGRLFSGNRLASIYLVIDNSFSMHYGLNFADALKKAEKLIASYSPKSLFYITPLCLSEDYKPLWVNQKTAYHKLKDIRLTFKSGSLKPIYDKFLKEKTSLPKEFVYIGDGQKINFKDLTIVNDFYWIPIPTGSNVAIENVSLKEYPGIIQGGYTLKTKLKNYSARPFTGKIELEARDHYQEQELAIPAHGDAIAFFTLPVYIRRGIIRVNPDSLPWDNEYYFSKSLPGAIKILIVGDARYIKKALAPSERVRMPLGIDLTTSIKNSNLSEYHIVILNGVEEITDFEFLKLQNFLSRQGTGLIVFPETTLGPGLKSLLAEEVEIEDWLDLEGYTSIKWIDGDFPPFSQLATITGWKGIKVFRLWKMKPKSRVLISLDNNLPFLITRNNIMVFATTFKESNTDIIYNPNFIPILHSCIYGLINDDIDREYRVDELERNSYLIAGDKSVIPQKPGFYNIGNDTIGVNVEPVESNLAPITPKMAKEMGIKLIDFETQGRTTDLTNIFLIMALFALIIEIILLLI